MGDAKPERGFPHTQLGAQSAALKEDGELQEEGRVFELMISKILPESAVPSNSSMKLDEGGMISRGDCSFSCRYDRIASGGADPLKSVPRRCRRTKSAVSEPSSRNAEDGVAREGIFKNLGWYLQQAPGIKEKEHAAFASSCLAVRTATSPVNRNACDCPASANSRRRSAGSMTGPTNLKTRGRRPSQEANTAARVRAKSCGIRSR